MLKKGRGLPPLGSQAVHLGVGAWSSSAIRAPRRGEEFVATLWHRRYCNRPPRPLEFEPERPLQRVCHRAAPPLHRRRLAREAKAAHAFQPRALAPLRSRSRHGPWRLGWCSWRTRATNITIAPQPPAAPADSPSTTHTPTSHRACPAGRRARARAPPRPESGWGWTRDARRRGVMPRGRVRRARLR